LLFAQPLLTRRHVKVDALQCSLSSQVIFALLLFLNGSVVRLAASSQALIGKLRFALCALTLKLRFKARHDCVLSGHASVDRHRREAGRIESLLQLRAGRAALRVPKLALAWAATYLAAGINLRLQLRACNPALRHATLRAALRVTVLTHRRPTTQGATSVNLRLQLRPLNATLLKSKQTRLWAACSALLEAEVTLGIPVLPCLWAALSVAVLAFTGASVDTLCADIRACHAISAKIRPLGNLAGIA